MSSFTPSANFVLFGPCGLQCGEMLRPFGVDRGQIVIEQSFLRFGGQRPRSVALRRETGLVTFLRNGFRFEFGQFSAEDAEIVNRSAFESAIAKAFTQRDVVAAATGDFLGEIVFDHLARRRFAVDEQLQAGRAAAAVVRHDDVHPFVDWQLVGRGNRNGIARPEVNQRPLQPSLFDQQFIAAAAGVGPGTRAMKRRRPVPLRRASSATATRKTVAGGQNCPAADRPHRPP